MVAPDSGAELQALGDVVAANWDASQSDRLAIARPDGSILIWSGGQLAPLAQRADLTFGGVVDVQFFTESWNGKNAAPRRHLLVQTENEQNGHMQFLALDGPVELDEVKKVSSAEAKPLQRGTRLKCSPAEGIIASGAPNGTVTVWYATPSYEPYPRQLFDLEGHRGGRITCVSFSNDGKTIITADEEERLFAWLSSDPLAAK